MCLKTFQNFAFMHVEAVWNVMFDPPCDIKCFGCCRAESVVAPAALICAVSILKRAIISLFKIQLICTTWCSQAGQNLFFFQYWLHIKSISFLKNDSKLKLINFPTIWNGWKIVSDWKCFSVIVIRLIILIQTRNIDWYQHSKYYKVFAGTSQLCNMWKVKNKNMLSFWSLFIFCVKLLS